MANIDTFLDTFEDRIEGKNSLSEQERKELAALVGDRETLGNGLQLIYRKDKDFTDAAKNADQQAKAWTETKRMWDQRHEELMKVLEQALADLKVAGQALKVDRIKLATRTRTCLEVDSAWLVQMFEQQAQAMQQQLPPYIKVSLTVDKNKLSAYLEQDNTLQLQHPEKIHTRPSYSTTITELKR